MIALVVDDDDELVQAARRQIGLLSPSSRSLLLDVANAHRELCALRASDPGGLELLLRLAENPARSPLAPVSPHIMNILAGEMEGSDAAAPLTPLHAADTTGAADATTAAPPPSLLASRPDTPGAGSPAHQRGSPAPGSASLAKGGRADVAGGRATPSMLSICP